MTTNWVISYCMVTSPKQFIIICLLFCPDSTKNHLALEVITRIILHCCWMNVHIVQPHDAVFEIRVAEGYGARWSKDGTKVRLYAFVFSCIWRSCLSYEQCNPSYNFPNDIYLALDIYESLCGTSKADIQGDRYFTVVFLSKLFSDHQCK